MGLQVGRAQVPTQDGPLYDSERGGELLMSKKLPEEAKLWAKPLGECGSDLGRAARTVFVGMLSVLHLKRATP